MKCPIHLELQHSNNVAFFFLFFFFSPLFVTVETGSFFVLKLKIKLKTNFSLRSSFCMLWKNTSFAETCPVSKRE